MEILNGNGNLKRQQSKVGDIKYEDEETIER